MSKRGARIVLGLTALAALCAGAALGATGTRDRPMSGAEAFAVRVVRLELAGGWHEQFALLHPADQALLSEAQFAACSSRLGTRVAATVHAAGVDTVPLQAVGIPQRRASLVTVVMRAAGSSRTATLHVHAVDVDGRWRWILAPPFRAEIAVGRCADGSRLETGPAL
jgi:hypothetical protein